LSIDFLHRFQLSSVLHHHVDDNNNYLYTYNHTEAGECHFVPTLTTREMDDAKTTMAHYSQQQQHHLLRHTTTKTLGIVRPITNRTNDDNLLLSPKMFRKSSIALCILNLK